jgi:rod shape-determining protein MreD
MSLMPATQRLGAWRWLGLPALACVTATLVFAVPLRVFGLGAPEPVFPLILAFAWAVIRPSILGPFALLLLGLLLDLLWDTPTGLWALALLSAYAMTLSVRRVLSGLGWLALAGWYAVAVGVAMGVGVVVTGLRAEAMPSPLAVFWQYIATFVLFPLANRLIERFEDADVRFR